MTKLLRWTSEEDQILKDNYNKISQKEIELLLPNRTYYAIVKRAMLKNCNDKGNHSHKKYSVNVNFFKEINIENSYWAGFLGADATIYSKNNVVAIKLQGRDIEILEAFKDASKFTGNIRLYDRYTIGPKLRSTCSINICGVPEWIKDLKDNFNVISNKSLILAPPNITNHKEKLAYIKGYIDGNGSLSISKTRHNKNRLTLSISTSKLLSKWITDFTLENYKSNWCVCEKPTKQLYNLFQISKSGTEMFKFLEDVAQSYEFGLKRKWLKLSPFIK
jgi:hypothetical protein